MSLRSELGVSLLLAAAIGTAVVAGSASRTPASELERASTFLTGPAGAKGVYEVMARMGTSVARRRISLFDLVSDTAARPAVLIEADPVLDLDGGELTEVAAFLRRGGVVVAAGAGGGILACAGWRLVSRPDVGLRTDTLPIVAADDLDLPGVRAFLRQMGATPEDTTSEARTIRELGEATCPALTASSIDTLVLTRSRHPVVVAERIAGGGRLILVADDGWLRNRAWRTTDVPRFILPLLTPGGGRRVQWDEYHQGYAEGGSLLGATWTWLTTTPGGWVLDQLVLVLLVWLAVTAIRFGPARTVIDRRRRSPIEHLEALSAGLETSGGDRTAIGLIIGGLRRRLSRTGQEPGGGKNVDPWLASLMLAMPTARGRGAVRRLREALTNPGDRERVLAAANSVEDVWEELRPRATRDAFSKP